jgi:hypothetical protein
LAGGCNQGSRLPFGSTIDPNTAEIDADITTAPAHPCPCGGGTMTIVELFEPGCQAQPITATIRVDTS